MASYTIYCRGHITCATWEATPPSFTVRAKGVQDVILKCVGEQHGPLRDHCSVIVEGAGQRTILLTATVGVPKLRMSKQQLDFRVSQAGSGHTATFGGELLCRFLSC